MLALPFVGLGFWLKARSEEQLLMNNVGERYVAYRREIRQTLHRALEAKYAQGPLTAPQRIVI